MTKERLRRYKAIRREITQIQEQIKKMRAEIEAPRGSVITGMPGTHTGGSALENAVIKLTELEDLYAAKVAHLLSECIAVENAIDGLEPRERQLMRARYIEGLTWEEVCVTINYSWQQTHRIHKRALEKIYEIE